MSGMTTGSSDWEGWAAEWRAQPGGLGTLEGVEARVRRETRSLRVTVALEALASAFVVAFWAAAVYQRPREAPVVAAAVASWIFIAVWLFTLAATLRGKWRALDRSTRAFLELTRERRRAIAGWHGFVRRCMLAFSAFFVPWALWLTHHAWDFYAAEPWRAVLGWGGFLAIAAVVWVFAGRRRREAEAELAAIERMLAELDQDT